MRTSSDRTTLSTTELAALGLLDVDEERSGYDLLKRAERGVGYIWAPAKSGLYQVLGRLEEAGLVAGRSMQERGPTKQVYRLTEAGLDALRSWASDTALELAPSRDPFLLKLFFARRLAPDAAIAQVEAYRAHLGSLLAEWEQIERADVSAGTADADLVALRFALTRARATLAWCDEAVAALQERA